jgi:plasmid stabilization system protein ParE
MTWTVRTVRRADNDIRRIDAWWREHREASPDLFLAELSDAFALLEVAAGAGRPYPSRRAEPVARILLRSTRYHVYFSVRGQEVFVLAVWSAVRGRGPAL